MRNYRLLGAVLVISLLAACGCGSSGSAGSSGIQTAASSTTVSSTAASSAAEEEQKTFDEGVDTKVSVTYGKYTGKNANVFLSQGDKVAVISPSALPSREQVDMTVEGLKKWGYEPVLGEHVCQETRTADEIKKDLEWALNTPDIKAIFCVRGGYGSTETMDEVPIDLIKKSNKLIIGYSDITVYHSAWTSAGLLSIQACMSGTFDGLDAKCVEAEEKILKGEIPTYTCEVKDMGIDGKGEGVLIGGNLSTYTGLLGTAYEASKTDRPFVLFLEDVGEDVQHIHRYLTVLKHLGVLDKANGIIFGEWTEVPTDMDDYDGTNRGGEFKSVADMITRQFLSDLECPVAFGFPAGHGDVNYPLLMGEEVTLEVTEKTYKISWE